VNVAAVCRRIGITRQNYYARRRQRRRCQVDGELVAQLVVQERQMQPRIGTRKLHGMLQPELKQAGVKLGRDRLFKELRARDLLVKRKPAEHARTTASRPGLGVFPNLVKDRVAAKANQIWVGDITYLRTCEGFEYLALLTDKHSRKIVGYHCADSLAAVGCLRALEMALGSLPAGSHPIHHSDRGTQYCCGEYVKRLRQRGLPISMTETNHVAENALAERVNGILKSEYGLGGQCRTREQARRLAAEAVWLYNTRRPHTALGYKIPAVVHSLSA